MTTGPICPISKLEKILLSTDGTENSDGAIREAIKFAAKCSSQMYVCMSIVSNPEYETIGSNYFKMEEDAAIKHLEAIKAQAIKEGLTCETLLRQSKSHEQTIVEQAQDKQVDMIVIGRHGHQGIAKLLIGEVAAKVIADAHCKVLVVPKAAHIGYKKILVATDGSPHAIAAVNEAIAIARKTGSHLIALSAMQDEREQEEANKLTNSILELAQTEGVSAEALTPKGKAANVIIETAGGMGVDLIVMGTYGKTGVKKLLMGSSTEKVIGNAGCAVLVVKSEE
jgi:nucleotide-binding universal stress UspA family protein